MAFGRKGERVAKTPTRRFPPSFGGRTVGDQVSRTALENCQISHRWENSSSPRSESGSRYSGSKIISDSSESIRPLWRGTPNLVGKSVWMRAMILTGKVSDIGILLVMVWRRPFFRLDFVCLLL